MSINYENIFEKGILVSLSMSCWAGRTKLTDEQLKDLPKEIVRGVSDLLIGDEKQMLQDIMTFDRGTMGLMKTVSLPFPIHGAYFVPAYNLQKAIDMLNQRKEEREKLIEIVSESFEQGMENFKEKYLEYYQVAVKNGKYPNKAEVKNKFGFEYYIFQINLPNAEKTSFVTSELIRQEMNKFKSQIGEMKEEVVNIICNELLNKAETLKKQSLGDGKPNQKTFNSLNEFFDTITTLYSDFVERKDVLKAVDKFKKAIGTTTAEDLRFDESFKAKFGEKIEGIIKTIQVLPDVKRKRAIEF